MSQQYSLRWNNHQPNFISMFTTLLNTQTLVDVTLAADGKQLLAHKVVLSACSTYFQSLFVDNPSPHPIVILKDVTYADLRTMVDFMYCGEVNVTEEQLPKVLDTAKLLKIKGLTEMPDSTSLTRSQGTSAEFQGDSMDSQRHSPVASPSIKRKRRRKSSTGSTSLNVVHEENRSEVGAQAVDAITLSSVPQQRRMREYHEVRTIDNAQQTPESDNLNVDQIALDTTPTGMPQESPNTDSGSRLRRTKPLKRQNRLPEQREIRKQVSEPAVATAIPKATPVLQKHRSYPQAKTSFANQPVISLNRQSTTTTVTSATVSNFDSVTRPESSQAQRASHTPAIRVGPPLSCNFCWNTVDECGRILRRKTQYHCPECRTNLCIVPCFHEYHEGLEGTSNNVR